MNLHVAAAIKGVLMETKKFLSFLSQHQQLDKKRTERKVYRKEITAI